MKIVGILYTVFGSWLVLFWSRDILMLFGSPAFHFILKAQTTRLCLYNGWGDSYEIGCQIMKWTHHKLFNHLLSA
jgi:hypothetical protein